MYRNTYTIKTKKVPYRKKNRKKRDEAYDYFLYLHKDKVLCLFQVFLLPALVLVYL